MWILLKKVWSCVLSGCTSVHPGIPSPGPPLPASCSSPLARIDDSLRLLGNQQCFSTMDLASGYWQVAMSPDAKQKAAFVTHEGLYQFQVMPFGLCHAPTTFERLMDRVLCGMRWSRCLVYLDDVISFGTTAPEALQVLERLSMFGLQLKANKCTFMQTEVAFLGHIVGRAGMLPVRLSKCVSLSDL